MEETRPGDHIHLPAPILLVPVTVTMPIEEYERLKRLEANDPFDPTAGMMAGRTYGEWKQSESDLKARVKQLEARLIAAGERP